VRDKLWFLAGAHSQALNGKSSAAQPRRHPGGRRQRDVEPRLGVVADLSASQVSFFNNLR
jgi:hypothetical protein